MVLAGILEGVNGASWNNGDIARSGVEQSSVDLEIETSVQDEKGLLLIAMEVAGGTGAGPDEVFKNSKCAIGRLAWNFDDKFNGAVGKDQALAIRFGDMHGLDHRNVLLVRLD